jgi:hypothetical protein
MQTIFYFRYPIGFFVAKNHAGQTGLVPSNFLDPLTEEENEFFAARKRSKLLLPTTIHELNELMTTDTQRVLEQNVSAESRRHFVALFDYYPATQSPNNDYDSELALLADDLLTVIGDVGDDGFFLAEMNGKRGFVPENFVEEIFDGTDNANSTLNDSAVFMGCVLVCFYDRQHNLDWQAGLPSEKYPIGTIVVALHDYKPEDLSPNDEMVRVCLKYLDAEHFHSIQMCA